MKSSGNSQFVFCLLVSSLSLFTPSARACDTCSLVNIARSQGPQEGSLSLAVYEEFSSYRLDKEESSEPESGEELRGISNTQLSVSYDLTKDISVALSLPILFRDVDSYSNYRAQRETKSGIGDMVISTSYYPYVDRRENGGTFFGLTAGLKLPTGDSGSLDSSDTENQATRREVISARSVSESHLAHPVITGASSGQVLSEGSGSFDYIFGASFWFRRSRLLLPSYAQYTLRSEGDFDYRFADDLIVNFSPGYLFYLEQSKGFALHLSATFENKGSDRQNARSVSDTAFSDFYLGPQLTAFMDRNWTADLGVDWALSSSAHEGRTEPDYRLRAGLNYRW